MNANDRTITRGSPPDMVSPTMVDQGVQAGCPSRILVVDDDPGIREILSEVLQTTGYVVRCAEDGEAGWTALCAESFDLLITDHEMPRLTGAGLLRRMRAGPLRLPVILISGKLVWPDPELLHVLPPGVAMAKPFSWAALLVNVRNFLASTTRAAESRDGPAPSDRDRRPMPSHDHTHRRATAERAHRRYPSRVA